MTYQDSLDSQYLSTSLSSLSHSRSTNSLIVRTYKQATQLYLTRRFKEALETLEPIISPQAEPSQTASENAAGLLNGSAEHSPNGAGAAAAPVAQCAKGTRTKVWVFYLSLLHAIIELGPEEGKLVFGSNQWRRLAAKAREGTIWDEIVRCGYGGNDGDVDADVVNNLATLLLGQMQSQRLNQQRLETWFATGGGEGQQVAFAGHEGIGSPLPNGTSTPKELATRLKVLELYTLHVLPLNAEWDYARQFIEMNDMLDEERKEAFLHALQSLKEEKEGTAQREIELKERREREMEEQRKEEEARRAEIAKKEEDRRRAAEKERQKVSSVKSDSSALSSRATNGTAKSSASTQKPDARPPSKTSGRKGIPPTPPPNLYRRASSVLGNLQRMVLHASRNLSPNNTMALLRMVMFVVAFLALAARRDLRLKIRRAVEDGWVKVKQTVGMGVKVSYM